MHLCLDCQGIFLYLGVTQCVAINPIAIRLLENRIETNGTKNWALNGRGDPAPTGKP